MKKVVPFAVLLGALALVGCNVESSSAPVSSSKPATTSSVVPSSVAPSSVAPSSVAPSSVAPSSQAPSSQQGHTAHTWTAGQVVKNSDQKDCTNYSCACGAVKVEIALADASEGASDIDASGKLGKSKTFSWKIVAPKAGTATFQMFVKYGQTGSSLTDSVRNTIWGNSSKGQNPYVVKVGTEEQTVLVNEKTYAETGVTEEGAAVDIATVTVVQGENVVSFTTPADQYYRNIFEGNVGLVFAA